MSQGPDPGSVLVGIFLILFGICMALVGGGCTIFLVASLGEMIHYDGGLGIFLLLLSVCALAIGVFIVRAGIGMLGPRDE